MSTSTLPRPSLPPSPTGGPPTAPLPSLPAKKSKVRKSLPAPTTRTSIASQSSTPTTPSKLRAPSSSSLPQSAFPTRTATPTTVPVPRRSIALQPSQKDRLQDEPKTLKKSISIAAFPHPPKPLSKIGRPSLGINTSDSISRSSTPQDERTVQTPQSAPAPRSKKLKSQSASSTLHSSFKNSTSMLNGSADTVPAGSRRSGSDGLNSAGSPARSRASSAEGSYSTTATTFEDDDMKANDDSDGSKQKDGKNSGNVVISVRVRPNSESDLSSEREWKVENKSSLISYQGKEGGEYYYDNVFASKDDNSRVYDSCARRLVRRVMEGFHGTVFAYGMTGTGKTFSMQGTQSSPGVIPRAVQDIFSYIRQTPHREFLLRVSYLEIYNEEIRDLLDPASSETGPGAAKAEKIKLREDSKGNVYAQPLKEEIVQSTNQLLQVIAKGDKSRRVGATQFNSHSSRSHAIVQIVVESRERGVGETSEGGNRKSAVKPGGVRVSQLSLIDLAGSERAAEDKTRRVEGAHINKSLLTLGTVISRLSDNKDGKDKDGKHLPYRDSKLTRLLQPALSGSSLISILCTIQIGAKAGGATAATHIMETLNTLKFAARARNNIVSHAKKAEEAGGPGDGKYAAQLEKYRLEIASLRGQLETQAVMQAEKQEKELEQEAHFRHEEQLLEMQLARTALRDRIEHLNQLILSSRSIGVNDTRASMFSNSSRLTSIYNGSDGGTRSVRSSTSVATLQTLARHTSVKSNATINSHFLALRSPHMSQHFLDTSPVSPADHDGSSMVTYSPDEAAALESQVKALQTDIADKNRYINTLEQRLLKARRTSHGRLSQVQSPLSSVSEKDTEIADLKAQLEERDRNVAELKAQNKTLTQSLMLMSPDSVAQPSPVFPGTPGAEPSKHETKGSTTSLDSGASLSPVETPGAPPTALRRAALARLESGSTPAAISAASSFSSLRTAVTTLPPNEPAPEPPVPRLNRKSVDEMSKILDEMIQDRVERGEITKSRSGSIHASRGRESRRQQSMGSVPTVANLEKRRQSQIADNRKSLGSQEPTPKLEQAKDSEAEKAEPTFDMTKGVGLGLEGVTT